MNLKILFQVTEEEFTKHFWPKFVESVKSENLSFETLWLILEINSKFPKFFNQSRNKLVFGRQKFVSDELMKSVTELLMVKFILFKFVNTQLLLLIY